MRNHKALIVGAGPIGLTLAIDLSRYGVSVKIIDKIPSEIKHSKKLHSKSFLLNSASLKVMQGLGIVEKFLARGKKIHDAEIYFNGKRTAHIEQKYLKSPYNYFISMPQPEIESILEETLKTYGVEVNYQQELCGIEKNETLVDVRINHLKSNSLTTEQFDFVIGCDGGHSKVRALLKTPMAEYTYDFYFIIADVSFENNFSMEKFSYFVFDDAFISAFLMSNGYTRVVIRKDGFLDKNKPQLNEQEMQKIKKEIQAYFNQHFPPGHHFKIKNIVWSSKVQLMSKIPKTGKTKNVFLAGDSYHVFSPVGGHNMNTGFQDALNLGWKLAYFLNGKATTRLLDSYNTERSIAIQKIFEATTLNTKLAMRRDKAHPKIEYFKPKMANRNYYRMQFAEEFSGYFANHAQNSNLVGQHVPYEKIHLESQKIYSTHDLPRLRKFAIFYKPEAYSTLKPILGSAQVEPVEVAATEIALSEKLLLDKDTICIVRPDGFIGFHGNAINAMLYFKDNGLLL